MRRLLFRLYRSAFGLAYGTGIGRIRWVGWLHQRLMRSLQPPIVEFDGHRLRIDPGDSLNLSLSTTYESAELAAAKAAVGPGDLALDIGANIGVYTLALARVVGPGGQVIAFEPEPANFRLLTDNVRHNGYHNVRAEALAVGPTSSAARLFLSSTNRGDHRLFAAEGPNRESIAIRCVALDEFLEPTVRPRLIKIDIQGAESGALRGMRRLIERVPRLTLLTEIWPAGLERAGSSAAEYVALLTELGFTLFILADDGTRTTATHEALTFSGGVEHRNLICERGA